MTEKERKRVVTHVSPIHCARATPNEQAAWVDSDSLQQLHRTACMTPGALLAYCSCQLTVASPAVPALPAPAAAAGHHRRLLHSMQCTAPFWPMLAVLNRGKVQKSTRKVQ
jgi:hypothetical protein